MDSMSTSSERTEGFSELTLRSELWARVRLANLGGLDPDDLLTGADGEIPMGQADPQGKIGDMIGTYWATLYLVGRRFTEVVLDSGLTGCRFKPVSVRGNGQINDVALLQIVGKSDPILQSGLDKRLNLNSWDGSDFFIPRQQLGIFLSPTASAVIRASKLRNVAVEVPGIEFI